MKKTVLIIGGGFSGTLTALHLLRGDSGMKVLLAEPEEKLGAGVAYGRCGPEMLLNVSASMMGAFPDDVGAFGRALESRPVGSGPVPRVVDGIFVSRCAYAEHLAETVVTELRTFGERFSHLRAEVIELLCSESGFTAALSSGAVASADAAILACGTLPRRKPADAGPKTIEDPWADDRWMSEVTDGTVLVVGTGLTAVDVTLYLLKNTGVRIYMLSRHGLLPLPHAPIAQTQEAPIRTAGGPLAMMRSVRAAAARAADWRGVIDAMRTETASIFGGWTVSEKRRFMRHAASYWSIHRHRIPPSVAEDLLAEQASGRLRLLAGKIVAQRESQETIEVSYRARGASEVEKLRVNWRIDCRGPAANPDDADSMLFRSMLESGTIRPHPAGAGLEMTDGFRVATSAPAPLYTIGTWLRGERWESVAVRELRQQALQLAEQVIAELQSRANR